MAAQVVAVQQLGQGLGLRVSERELIICEEGGAWEGMTLDEVCMGTRLCQAAGRGWAVE